MTMQTKQTQLEAILYHLLSGNAITQLEALAKYGCLRLSAVIYTLRKEGYPIKTLRIQPQGYASYSLTKEA